MLPPSISGRFFGRGFLPTFLAAKPKSTPPAPAAAAAFEQRLIERALSIERLRQVLDYDPEKGILIWRTTRGSRAPAGKPAGSHNGNGYLVIKVDGQRFLAHRLAWAIYRGEWPAELVDHVNRVRDDNRIANLRAATYAENLRNAVGHRDSLIGLKGVTPSRGKHQAQIKVGGRNAWLGRFPTAEAAHAAYAEAARRHFGEFARAG